jgi:hypothetical protein
VKPFCALALLLGLSTIASADGFAFGIVTSSPTSPFVCSAHSTTSAVSCVSDSGSEGYASISASPLTDGITFSETFTMGDVLFPSFGNLNLIAYEDATDPLGFPFGFYTMTVLEQGTCTSNIAGACSGFGFQFGEYPPSAPGTFTSSPELETVTGSVFSSFDSYEATVVSNHTTVANENTSISGSLQIESITFSPTPPSPVPEPNSGQLVTASLICACLCVWLRRRRGPCV